MDKNTVIGFILIGLVLVLFTWLNKPTPAQIEARRVQDSIAFAQQMQAAQQIAQQPQTPEQLEHQRLNEMPDSVRNDYMNDKYGAFASAMQGEETTTTLENNNLEIHLSSKGGQITYVRLKNHVTHDSQPLVLFDKDNSRFDLILVTANNRVLNTANMYFSPVKTEGNTIAMRLHAGEDAFLDFVYTLKEDDYMLQFDIIPHGLDNILSPSSRTIDFSWYQTIRQQEKSRKFEDQFTGLFYKYYSDDVESLNQNKAESKRISNRLRWIAYKDKFFSSILISEQGFEATILDSKPLDRENYLKEFNTQTTLPFDPQGQTPINLKYYFGPNKYSLLKAYDKGVPEERQLDLKKLVPLGYSMFRWVNQYFILPIFAFLCAHIPSIGLSIFLLTLIVKLILFPLTYKSYISSAKMRVLRPQIEEINAKHPGQDKAMERQKATMELYRRAGINPMAGCLPMLLQMPILFALYWLFPANFDLRQQGFLWANDLSGYDAIFSWHTNIPFISSFYGNHISLFCLIMAVAQAAYTKINNDMMNTGQQQMPGMKLMMYLMPLMMLCFFNQSASGLSYYFLISSLISMAQTFGFRFLINEQKLLAQLEANKKKPKKKSNFMKRLEDMQRAQESKLKSQQQKGKRK
ncbi:MAG: membrane protein insertase YidC [Tannerellaceae bacterium]|jgi:YidC/Oxa1 family membrane protein insertase|nr:membrane protein insertase YidC [Tannerellaceae bacterium]